MPLNPRKIYGFPQYPMTEETQTAEQDIKKAAMEGVSRTPDTRLMDIIKKKKREPIDPEIEIEIEVERLDEPEDEMSPREKLDQEISENENSEIPDSYFKKHLVEAISSGDPGMMALGLDCLNEVIGLLSDEKRKLVKDAWEDYFENDPEFKKIEEGELSDRLKTVFKSEFVPLMMGKARKKFENKEF